MATHNVIRWLTSGNNGEHEGDCIEGSILGYDYTLCGKSLDGDSDTTGEFEVIEGRITCASCLRIIRYCKSIKL